MYRIGRDGQSVQLEQMRKKTFDHERVLKRLLTYYKVIQSCLPEEKQFYMRKGIASMLASQYKIYLTGNQSDKKKMINMDQNIKSEYYEIYIENENRAVEILRKTGFRLYKYFSLLVNLKYRE
jgi:hypothetical protein